ncbi:hypothetical protein DFH09DRAFT_925199, partial [Mycena vulgaris]
LIECLVGTVFGAIHCAAWNSDLPSAAEREFSLIVSAIPVLVPAAVCILRSREDLQTNSMIAIALAVPAYTTARLFLIILPFISLRALPPGAFTDVNWSVYIPHLQRCQ